MGPAASGALSVPRQPRFVATGPVGTPPAAGGYWCRGLGRRRQEIVLLELAQPARSVACHVQRVVVDARVAVGLVVAQHRMHHPQQLVGHREDRLLVAEAPLQRRVQAVELRALGARRPVGALGQRGAQRRVARAQASGAALAGALVVPRTDPGPRRHGRAGAEHAPRLRAQLGQQRVRADAGDARNRLQQIQLAAVGGQRGLVARVQLLQAPGEPVEILEQGAEAPERLGVELRSQGARQAAELAAHVRREAREDALRGLPRAQAVEDPAPVGAEDVGQHAAQPQAVVVEGLLHPVAQPGAVGDDLAPVPALVAQGHEQGWRHVAGTRQAELADARQPQAVGDVGLAALDLLDMLGVHQRGPHAGRLDGPQGRVPIHAGGLHHGRGHAVSAEPVGERGEGLRVGAENGCVGARRAAVGLAEAHAGSDLHLVDVEARGARHGDGQGVAGRR